MTVNAITRRDIGLIEKYSKCLDRYELKNNHQAGMKEM